MSKKQKKMLIRIIAAGAIWAIGFAVEHIFPTDDRFSLLGYKSGEDLQREVGNARFTVLSSEWRENMPYSGLESLAAQTPIIGARIGGIPELVEEGKTGVTFESGDAVDLLNSMRKCSAVSASSYSSMQRFCREYVNARCLQNKYALTLIDLYERVI